MNIKKERKTLNRLLDSNIAVLVIILVLVVAFFTIMNSNYISSNNLIAIMNSALLPGLMSIGMTFLIIGGQIDLSCGAAGAKIGRAHV